MKINCLKKVTTLYASVRPMVHYSMHLQRHAVDHAVELIRPVGYLQLALCTVECSKYDATDLTGQTSEASTVESMWLMRSLATLAIENEPSFGRQPHTVSHHGIVAEIVEKFFEKIRMRVTMCVIKKQKLKKN